MVLLAFTHLQNCIWVYLYLMIRHFLIGFALLIGLEIKAQTIDSLNLRCSDSVVYITSCDEFCNYEWYYLNEFTFCANGCSIDFSKYDLQGIKVNGRYKWTLIEPKRYVELVYSDVEVCDSIPLIRTMFPIVTRNVDSMKPYLVCSPQNIPENVVMIAREMWLDCHGYYYFKVLYDAQRNEVVCKSITIYGGSRGMCPKPSVILIKLPNARCSIRVDE